MQVGDFSVFVLCRNKDDGTILTFSRIYGPCDLYRLECLWEELSRVKND